MLLKIGDTHLNPDHIITIYDDGDAISVEMTNGNKHQFFNYGATALRRWLAANGEELDLRDDDDPLYEPGEEVIVNGVPHYVVRYHGSERITVVPAQHVLRIHVGLVSGIGDDDEDDDPQPAPVETPEPKFCVGQTVGIIGTKYFGEVLKTRTKDDGLQYFLKRAYTPGENQFLGWFAENMLDPENNVPEEYANPAD